MSHKPFVGSIFCDAWHMSKSYDIPLFWPQILAKTHLHFFLSTLLYTFCYLYTIKDEEYYLTFTLVDILFLGSQYRDTSICPNIMIQHDFCW